MKEFRSGEYRLVIDHEGVLKCFRLAPRELRIMKSTPDGGLDVEYATQETASNPSDRRLLSFMDRAPLFIAAYGGEKDWHVDLDCGFQRWHGVKSDRELNKALRNCGFKATEIVEIRELCKQHQHDYCPRVH